MILQLFYSEQLIFFLENFRPISNFKLLWQIKTLYCEATGSLLKNVAKKFGNFYNCNFFNVTQPNFGESGSRLEVRRRGDFQTSGT